EEGVPHPNVVSESGRGVAAHHSCVIMNILDAISVGSSWRQDEVVNGSGHDAPIVAEIRDVLDGLTKKNMLEAYHDAQAKREEALSAFRLGILSLEERAAVEAMYWEILHRLVALARDMKRAPKDILELRSQLTDQYISNFSLFQSAIDHWAFKQVFPVVPLQRLDEAPSRDATIVDITCDSDGKIERFADPDGPKETLPLHELRPDEPYYVGIFLTGAYQDIMGDLHNLFGRTNEVHVFCDDEDPEDFYIETVMKGDVVAEVLSRVQYEPRDLLGRLKSAIDGHVKEGRLKPKDGVSMLEILEAQLRGYTYLDPRGFVAAGVTPVVGDASLQVQRR
ncbi:MAG: biosynthetic arginine decarboxylase, partial [bacterium]